MTGTTLNYAKMMEDALVGVVRGALQQVADGGLPGAHHFYITFRTGDDGVEIDDFLRARYPEEMTIVLQHQFWDLDVGDDRFSVLLSFNDTPSKLTVPYAALTAFIDPSVKFGLQFDDRTGLGRSESAGQSAVGGDGMQDDREPGSVVVAHIENQQDSGAPAADDGKSPHADRRPGKERRDPQPNAAGREPDGGSDTAEVVALDKFRRKK